MPMTRPVRLFVLSIVTACRAAKPSSPPPPADVWALAPTGVTTVVAMSMTGHERFGAGVRVAARLAPGFAAGLAADEDGTIDEQYPLSSTRSAESIGLRSDGSFATYYGPWGSIHAWPTSDARRFQQFRGGTTAGGVDRFRKQTCKAVRGVYACSDVADNLDRIGDGKGLPAPGAGDLRPDLVIFTIDHTAAPIRLLDALVDGAGPLTVTAQLDVGQVRILAALPGRPRSGLALLADAPRHQLRTDGLSGFIASSAVHLSPIASSRRDFSAALAHAVAVELAAPVGDRGARATVTFREPASVARALDTCAEGNEGVLSNDPARPGECLIHLPAPFDIDAVAWMDGDVLQVAGVRGAAPATPELSTRGVGDVLAARPWTTVVWARGAFGGQLPQVMLPLSSEGAFAVLAHLTEVGFGIDVRADRIEVEAALRFAEADPEPARTAYIDAIGTGSLDGLDARLAAFAAAHPTARLADDIRAGRTGGRLLFAAHTLLVPTFAMAVPEAKIFDD